MIQISPKTTRRLFDLVQPRAYESVCLLSEAPDCFKTELLARGIRQIHDGPLGEGRYHLVVDAFGYASASPAEQGRVSADVQDALYLGGRFLIVGESLAKNLPFVLQCMNWEVHPIALGWSFNAPECLLAQKGVWTREEMASTEHYFWREGLEKRRV